MRVAAIFPPGRRDRHWQPFQQANAADWTVGVPACAAEADAIVTFGGDGTIHRHLAEFVKLQLPVLLVPCGGGNDMARALGLRSRSDSLAAWHSYCAGGGNVRTIDLGLIRPVQVENAASGAAPAPPGHYFCTVGGIGVDTEVARRANQFPAWFRRWGGYAVSLPPVLAQSSAVKMQLRVNEEEPSASPNGGKRSILTAFANAPAYGGGMKIAPRAQLDDGRLDICSVGDIGRIKLLCLFPTVFFGRHLGIAGVEYFQAERLSLQTEKPVDVYADGEFVCRTPVEVSVEPRVLQVIVPAQA
ncbi:MAG TPA: diacylglycerol kinase family protein [Terriglobales bacterium]|nr:diacylglycerol kinase family protein [Terriglobales bacterium]